MNQNRIYYIKIKTLATYQSTLYRVYIKKNVE